MDAESGQVFLGGAAAGRWPLHAERPLQDWVGDPECTLADSESEDDLHGVDPNEVFGVGAEPSSDSDVSSAPATAVSTATSQPSPATVYQVVYDLSGLGGAGTGPDGVVAIELDRWGSPLLLSDSCVVDHLPATSAGRPDGDPAFPDLQLTDEEQKLLALEGVSLPRNLPLTKAEERVLKKVRRKIRNKQSAQDSRRRRKEYIDNLESRAATCSQQNRELQRTVERLEQRNVSLLAQLQQLQSLIKRTASRGAQTSTCLLIILLSLALIILPSFSPFSRLPADDLRPRGVFSRTILTDPAASQPAPDHEDGPRVRAAPAPPSELSQSGHPESPAVPPSSDGATQLENRSGNSSASAPPTGPGPAGGPDTAKPAHADEM